MSECIDKSILMCYDVSTNTTECCDEYEEGGEGMAEKLETAIKELKELNGDELILARGFILGLLAKRLSSDQAA